MKKTKSKTKNKAKKATIIVASILLSFAFIYSSAYFIAGSYFLSYALDATFASVSSAPKSMVPKMPKPATKDQWFGQIEKEERTIVSEDGYELKAYYVNGSSLNNFVILVHGYRSSASEMSNYAFHYFNEGFNVLIPCLEGHGQSEGKYIGMGYGDRLDILKWINLIIEENKNAKIVLHGVSMGAATVMFASGEQLPNNVVCVIEDCGYSNVYYEFKHVVENVLNLPFKKTIMSAANTVSKLKLKVSLKNMDVIKAVERSLVPILFIHGSADNFVPFYMLYELYEANNKIYKDKLVIDGAGHAYCSTKNPNAYYLKVFEFINKFI